uniref:Bm10311 n=1 Tax=Brugia malayi TaxID=6279 RepID=A0A1I9G361_BRUMA|nr:Bm10311 [Brugia malayi]
MTIELSLLAQSLIGGGWMTSGSGRQHICWLIWQQTGGRGKCVVVGGKVAGGGEKRWIQQQKLEIPIQDISPYHFVLI